jgi:hypothetical protein
MGFIDEYFTRVEDAGRLPLPGEGERDLSLLWHESRESCERGHREIGLGVVRGHLVYVHAKPCFYTPEI